MQKSSINLKKCLKTTNNKNLGIHDIDISPDNEHLAIIHKNNYVYIINLFTDYQKNLKTNSNFNINVVTYNHNGSLLAGGSNIGKIIIWDCNLRNIKLELIGHTKTVLCQKFNHNGKYLISGGEDFSVFVFNVEMGSVLLKIDQHTEIIRTVGFNLKGEVISASDDKTVRITTLPVDLQEKKKSIKKKILNTFRKKEKNGNVLFIDEDFISIAINNDGKKLVASFENRKILVWSLESLQLEKITIDYDDIIEKLYFHSDELIILTTRSGSAKIFNIESQIIEKVIKGYSITDMVSTNDNKWLVIGTDKIYLKFAGINYEDFISLMNFIKIVQNYSKRFSQYDDATVDILSSFFNLLDEYLNETVLNIALLEFPFDLTILHFFCYLDESKPVEFLTNLLIANKIFIPPSVDYLGKTALEISIKNNNSTILNSLLQYYSHEDIAPLSFQSCSISYTKILPDLLDLKVNGLADFLNSRIFKAPGKIPDFCEKPKQKIKIFSFHSPMPKEVDYCKMLLYKKVSNKLKNFNKFVNKMKITEDIANFKTLFVNKVDLKKRSKVNCNILDLKGVLDPNLKFLDKLIEYPANHPIFAGKVVYLVIQYKWQTFGRKKFIRKAIAYLIFVVLCTVNSIYLFPERIIHKKSHGKNDEVYKIPTMIVEANILIYILIFLKIEITKIIKFGFWAYWRSAWNFIDGAIIILKLAYLIPDLAFGNDLLENEIVFKVEQSLGIFLVYFRLISYIRCFDNLSFMIRMIVQCVIDMRFFLFIIAFMMVPISLASIFILFLVINIYFFYC